MRAKQRKTAATIASRKVRLRVARTWNGVLSLWTSYQVLRTPIDVAHLSFNDRVRPKPAGHSVQEQIVRISSVEHAAE